MANKYFNISVYGGDLIDNGYYYVQYSTDNITFTSTSVILTYRGQVSTATLSELISGVVILAPDTSNYFKVQSVSTTCSGTDPLINGCYEGVSTVYGNCSNTGYGIFALQVGNKVTIVPYGSYYSGTGYRSTNAYLQTEAGITVQSFLMEQTDDANPIFTPTSYVLSTSGNYSLYVPAIDCTNGSGQMGLAITNCGPV